MAGPIYIRVEASWVWREVDPDGSVCDGCEEVCYLHQNSLFLESKINDVRSVFYSMTFCDSCKEVVDDSLRENG